MYRALFGLALLLTPIHCALAQPRNVQDAIDVIVLFCVAGGDRVEISGSADNAQGVEVKRSSGASGTGIAISRSSARGLVDGIIHQMNSVSANQASEARRCMQPYIERMIDLLLGGPPPASTTLPPVRSGAITIQPCRSPRRETVSRFIMSSHDKG